MLVMPAIDLRDGACVQLVGGEYARERWREPDPLAVARRWADAGFTRVHAVDLDAATGAGSNAHRVEELLGRTDVAWQVGGGVRSNEDVERLLWLGATAVVVGTRALDDPEWLERAALTWPHRLIVALDLRAGAPVVAGWTRNARLAIDECIERLEKLPIAALLVTCVDVEGQMRGPALDTLDRVQARTSHALIASGGIASLDDLRALRARGFWGCVVGMALYTGALDARAVAEEFGR